MSVDLTGEDLAEFAAAVGRADGLHVHYDIDYSGVNQEGTITGPTLDIEAAVNLLRWAPWALQALQALRDERAENERLRYKIVTVDGLERRLNEAYNAEAERDSLRAENQRLSSAILNASFMLRAALAAPTGQETDHG